MAARTPHRLEPRLADPRQAYYSHVRALSWTARLGEAFPNPNPNPNPNRLPEARQAITSDILAPSSRLPLRQSRTPRRATQVRYLVACSGVTLLSPRYAARRAGRRRCVLHLVWLACCGYTDHDCTNLAYAYCGCTYGGCTYCDTIEDALATLYLPGAAAPWLHSPLFVYGSIYRSGRSPATTCCGARQPAPCSPHGVRGWGHLPRRPTLTLALTLTWP